MNQQNIQQLYQLAKVSEQNRDWPSALDYYQKLYQLTNQPSLLGKIGFIYSQLRNHEQSFLYYQKYLNFEKSDWAAYYNIAVESVHLKKFEEAIQYLKKAILLQPQNLKSYLLIGYIYELLSQYEDAIKYFNHVLKLDPHNKVAVKGILFSLIQLKKYETALKICEKYLKIYPEDLMLKNFHAGILFELGKTDAFYEEIKEISEKDKRYKSFEEYVQKIQQERKDEYKEFLNEIQEKILQKQQELEQNEDTKTYLDLSLLSLFSGNKDEALNYLKKALDLGQKD
jgi:tetratricopeptide (TPR) repeat protein